MRIKTFSHFTCYSRRQSDRAQGTAVLHVGPGPRRFRHSQLRGQFPWRLVVQRLSRFKPQRAVPERGQPYGLRGNSMENLQGLQLLHEESRDEDKAQEIIIKHTNTNTLTLTLTLTHTNTNTNTNTPTHARIFQLRLWQILSPHGNFTAQKT